MLRNARLALFAGIAGLAIAQVGTAQAQTSSDESAAILVWPKVVYDSQGVLFDNPTDTLINLSSTATSSLKQAHCFLVNATSHCEGGSADGDACLTSATCGGGVCRPSWNEIDFNVFLAPEHRDRVFERFYRVDKSRSRAMGGTGLGLALVKWAAEAHGGRVELDTEVGRGSTFRIRLPA